MFWLIVGFLIGFYAGVWSYQQMVRIAYPHIYNEIESGEWKTKYYNAKAKESEDDYL